MPGVFFEPIDRKSFLRLSAQAIGAMALGSTVRLSAADANSAASQSVRLALLSDTHIPADENEAYRGFRPVENLSRAVPEVEQTGPEGVIINGDAARLDGQLADYQALQTLLKPIAQNRPVFIGLGNHDDRGKYFEVFGRSPQWRQPVAQKHVLAIETAVVRVVILDSLLYVNRVAGLLGKAQRTWLDEFLRQAEPRPSVLFVHHTLGDGDSDLLDADRLFRIIEPHSHVKAVFYGHSHRYEIEQRGRIHLVNLPALGYNFADSQPVGWVDATFTAEGVELTLRVIGGSRDRHDQTTPLRWS